MVLSHTWHSGNSTRIRSQMRCAVWRCLRGAFRSASKIPSTNAAVLASFQRGRSVLFRGLGSALPIASRTIRRCTFSFLATPAIVPTPNSYSLRISSNSSTFALQSNESLRGGLSPASEYPFVQEGGPKQTSELGHIRIPKSDVRGRINRPRNTTLVPSVSSAWSNYNVTSQPSELVRPAQD